MSRNSTGKVAIRLQLMSSETNFKPVTSKTIRNQNKNESLMFCSHKPTIQFMNYYK